MTNEIKPAWCGLPLQDKRVPSTTVTYLGAWQLPAGPLAFCCKECLDTHRRVGWHAKFSPRPEPKVFECTTLATEDLEKERMKAENEIKRLKRKVNRLRAELIATRNKSKWDEVYLNAMTDKRNECIRQNTAFRDDNARLGEANSELKKFVFQVLDEEAKSREPYKLPKRTLPSWRF